MNNPQVNNSLYLRRRRKVVLPEGAGGSVPPNYVASAMKNVEALGFTFSEALTRACQDLSLEQLAAFYRALVPDLQRAKGAHRAFKPMYPNFPAQVMAMAEGQLYLNAIVHYLSGGKLFPRTDTKVRAPLSNDVAFQVIDLGTRAEFEGLFGQTASSNGSLSEQDKEDLTWFVSSYGDDVGRLLPETVPQKENMAFLASLLMQHTASAEPFISRFCRTATDVLRLAVALSGGDVSLALPTKFRTLSRPERRLLLGLLERQGDPTEDMLRWKNRWIRLGEKLHVGEYKARYPRASAAFDVLRDGLPFITFNGRVEKALESGDVSEALDVLTPRPGDLARRLDLLLRAGPARLDRVLEAFSGVAAKVATPVLLQVMNHFETRGDGRPLRVFFPKGSLAKAHGEPNRLPALPEDVCGRVARACREALSERFRSLPPLGRCFVDPALCDYPVPFSQRSASKSFRTVSRGSKLPLLVDGTVLRLFV